MYTKETIKKHNIFFDKIIDSLKLKKVDGNIIAVLHILPDIIPFIRALKKIATLHTVIPKPKSIDFKILKQLNDVNIKYLFKDDISKSDILLELPNKKTVFSDIGGYFANITKNINKILDVNFAGIVEDTENGYQRYLNKGKITIPFIQVARSPLKENEDYMVGQAIVFSVEALLRNSNVLFNGLTAGIIGYGKIGRSIANSLKNRQCNISVFDINFIQQTHSYSHGFDVKTKIDIIRESDLLCLSTGNFSLSNDDYKLLKNGAFVFSVTSSDDELDMKWLLRNYKCEEIMPFVSRYSNNKHYFYLLNKGNAINFIYGTTVGDFILLVHAELLCAIYLLLTKKIRYGAHEVSNDIRNKISKVWLDLFTK